MLDKKDFLEFFSQLMAIEVEMEHGALELRKYIKNKKATSILEGIAESERQHEKIILEIEKIIKKHYA